jgi:DNA-binding MarR family transcriptional regulator/GNAT superfamily N-acetyltransferase
MAWESAPDAALRGDIAVFRHFNRMYTRFLGTLNEGFLDSPYTLAEGRVLYELATRTASNATDIAEELGMDPGYLSRMLGKFERDTLLKKRTSEQDGRSNQLRLTSRGKAAFENLNALSQKQASVTLGALPLEARTELTRSMIVIEGILAPRGRQPFVLRPPRVGDMGQVVHSESVWYAEEFGWDQRFEALVAGIVSEFVAGFDPGRESCWIAEIDGRHVGHIFLVAHPDRVSTARLRLLFVDSAARGMGLGRALVTESIRFARTAGYRRVVLWTQSILSAAHRIYEKAGFRLVKEEPHESFGARLIGQEWELEL